MTRLQLIPPLEPEFFPASVRMREFLAEAEQHGKREIAVAVFRHHGRVSVFRTALFRSSLYAARNLAFLDGLVRTLLWAKGGYDVRIAGADDLIPALAALFLPDGAHRRVSIFMQTVYEHPFSISACTVSDIPEEQCFSVPVGRHLNGCRIGFDAGGSDRKVCALIDGRIVFSEEVLWHPKEHGDLAYHRDGIRQSLLAAARHLPRVDAIGISTAGVCTENRVMKARIFGKVDPEVFVREGQTIYLDVTKEFGQIPVAVANDGDVAALAGAMTYRAECVLGIAMGTSEAGGYIDVNGNMTDCLNELSSVPVAYQPSAPIDERMGDRGGGQLYFSQDAVIRFAERAGVRFDPSASPAEKLKHVQKLMDEQPQTVRAVYETVGICFGYQLAYYAMFYDIRHVLLLGRVMTGSGGTLILEKAEEVLLAEFPSLYSQIRLHLPDEHTRRIGQSAAAASLPII